jgi:hypothetical protein
LEQFLAPVLLLCFPHVEAQIDWSRPFESLDTELHEIMRGQGAGRMHVDKLFRVWLRNGEPREILLHVEVQEQPQNPDAFAARVFFYHARLCERGHPVLTLVILADDNPNWRPSRYEHELLGCRLTFDFPVCKLLDLIANREALERSQNPAAVLALANWAAQQTGGDAPERLRWKLRLTRELYRKGFEREDFVRLYRLVDWLLQLPPPMEQDFRTEIRATEQNIMPYISSIERLALEEGRQEGLLAAREMIKDTLLVRFGSVSEGARQKIDALNDLQALTELHRRAVACPSLEKFLLD